MNNIRHTHHDFMVLDDEAVIQVGSMSAARQVCKTDLTSLSSANRNDACAPKLMLAIIHRGIHERRLRTFSPTTQHTRATIRMHSELRTNEDRPIA